MRGPTLLGRSLDPQEFASFQSSSSLSRRLRSLIRRQTNDDAPSATAASFFIPNDSLLGLPDNSTLTLFSGLLPSAPVDVQTDAELFFLLVRNRHIADRERLVIWMNGGPGCSSFDGALMEIGPFRLLPGTQQLHEVDGAWNEYANVLFLDQPAGTGYSFVSTNQFVHELDDAANQVVAFLKRFYAIFPEFSTMDTYIAGESYAGQYIPYTADAILKTTEISTPLKGLLIGNGWIDGWYQYPAYMPFSYQNGVLKEGSAAAERVEAAHARCITQLEKLGYNAVAVHDGICEGILSLILDSTRQTVNGAELCINTYDVRLTDYHPACGMNWPPDLSSVYSYLPREDVKNAFHASKHEGGWTECNGAVGGNFWATRSKPSGKLLPDLLQQLPILLFAGDQDLICNWMGVYNLSSHLTWNGATGFQDAPELPWSFNGNQVGTWQSARNLTFVKVFNTSHMVPFDELAVTHDMLLRFMNTDFLSAAGPSAKIPSRVGSEVEAVVGETHPNGTAFNAPADDDLAYTSPDSPNKGAAAVQQAYYNAGSAALLVLLVIACAGIFLALRSRIRRGAAAAAGRAFEGLPETPRRRKRISGRRKHRKGALSLGSTASEASHELDELVVKNGKSAQDDEDDEEKDDEYGDRLPRYPDGRGRLGRNEEIFSLGDADEADVQGDLGRAEEEKRP